MYDFNWTDLTRGPQPVVTSLMIDNIHIREIEYKIRDVCSGGDESP